MIKECNFKIEWVGIKSPATCKLSHNDCPGEAKCILFQMYKMLDAIALCKGHEKTLWGLAEK